MKRRFSHVTAVWICFFGLAKLAAADPRPFTFTSDAYPMGKGQWEIEQWVTYSGERGNDSEFMRFDFRTELELGLADNFDLAIYFPEIRHEDSTAGGEDTSLHGGAIEAVVYLTNPVKDFLGIALYGEVKIREDELEFEQKLILQKDIGKWIFAYNLVLETEIEGAFEEGENEIEGILQNTFGVAYAFLPGWTAGGEMVIKSVYEDWENYEGTAVHIGPVLSYQGGKVGQDGVWWVTVTPMFQVTDEDSESDFMFRMIFGIGF